MKTVLFSTDFSRAASKAARFAVQFAQQVNAKLILLHASRPILSYTPDMQGMIFDQNYENKINKNKLNRLARKLAQFIDQNVKIECYLKEGFVVDVIEDAIANLKPNYLIMSTVGQLPQSSKLFGSVSTEMISKSSVPLLLIPPKAKFKAFENIFLAIDIKKNIDAITLQKVIAGLKPFNSIINVFSVVENPNNPSVKEAGLKVREILKEFPHLLHIVEGKDFVHSFLQFTKKNKADLIIMMPKHHNFIEKWFVQSNTENVALSTNLPLITFS
jgi:nucleotide-binding universal stress UspA family protein